MAQMHKDDHIRIFLVAVFTVAKKAVETSVNRGLVALLKIHTRKYYAVL